MSVSTVSAHLHRRIDHDSSRCSSVTSSGASVVVLQHATESFSALDLSRNGIDIIARIDELVAEALMVSLAMIMLERSW